MPYYRKSPVSDLVFPDRGTNKVNKAHPNTKVQKGTVTHIMDAKIN